MKTDYQSLENRKKQSFWANKLSTAKHKRIMNFMIIEGTNLIQKVYWYDDGVSEEHGDDNDGYLFGIYRYNDYEHDPIPNDAEWFKTEEERDISFSKEMK